MIKLENCEILGWEHAIRGMRNPKNSWDRSDTKWETHFSDDRVMTTDNKFMSDSVLNIGPNDHDLMMRLRNAGTDHRKFMRMITVYVDITAPLYWWKEFDTYKVGTVRNSCSTMHKIHVKEFTRDDFSHEHIKNFYGFKDKSDCETALFGTAFNHIISDLNHARDLYLQTGDKQYWWQMIQLLPSSYNQRATVMLNYEVLANIYKSRKNHKLDEWVEFCKWIETLPYSELITGKVIGIDLSNGPDMTGGIA